MEYSESKILRFSGSCLCGAVTFSGEGAALFVAHCQCLDCRKSSGTGHSTDAGFRAADVTISGALARHETVALSGNRILRSFCPACGSKIATSNSAHPEDMALNLAVFDDPEALSPDTVFFTEHALAWDLIDPSLKAYQTQP